MSNIHPVFEDIFKRLGVPPESIEMQAYRAALKRHDWSHEFSDDGVIYNRGRESLLRLKTQQQLLDPQFQIWNAFAPPGYQHDHHH